MPALPLNEAGEYVAAAYIVFFALVLIYVSIMAIRLRHIERDLSELLKLTEAQGEPAQEQETDHSNSEQQAGVA
ncbi:MAG TPA: hypothetical protein VIC05_11670 [Solirubrobacteraceae bacterium]|jgi:hypothetical protein